MKFDLFASFADTELATSAFRVAVRTAALLEVPEYDREPSPTLLDDFRLPWNTACFEDENSVVMLHRGGCARNVSSLNEEAIRTARFKDFAHIAGIDVKTRHSTADLGLQLGDVLHVAFAQVVPPELLKENPRRHHELVALGSLIVGDTSRYVTEQRLAWVVSQVAMVVREPRGWREVGLTGVESQALQHELMGQTIAAVNQACYVARPSNWILKRVLTPAEQKARDKHGSKKTPRSHERDRWLLITDKERVRYFRERETVPPTGKHHASPIPHARRAHYRHIGENPDGTRRHTWVRACWVGSTEAEIHGNKYRVELDL